VKFNFGPIARTDASEIHDTFNLAALPLHEMLNALMGATNRDEFVAWLWHDLFKPAFYWRPNNQGEFSWNHNPGRGPFVPAEAKFADASVTNISGELVRTHHFRPGSSGQFKILEQDVISDQVEQVNLGAAAVYVQLAFVAEPALPTALVRAVIADSFMEAVTRSVAQALSQTLTGKPPAFSRVRFVFETQGGFSFSAPPTEAEIWNQVGQRYDVCVKDDELVMRHLTPVSIMMDTFGTEVVIDLTGAAPSPEQLLQNTLGLAELLVAYQDGRTVIMTVPQPSIYMLDIAELRAETLRLAREKLGALDVLTADKDTDLLAAVFDTQVYLREIPGRVSVPPHVKKGSLGRLIDTVINYPTQQLANAAKQGRHCRVCGSAFISNLPPKDDWPGPDFTDAEHLGIQGDICPLCRIYAVNSHKSHTPQEKASGVTGDRKAMRGSFALILPSSRFHVLDEGCRLIERPPLDVGGRFDPHNKALQRVTVTQQESALFAQISRRIIAQLWRRIEPTAPLPLPYVGGVLLTHREGDLIKKVLPALRELFTQVMLRAYPFEVEVIPHIELALEVALKPDKQHHTKHTLLKSRPAMLPVHPNGRLLALADNKMQVEISRDWFAAYDTVAQLVSQMPRSQRDEWLRRIAEGGDPATAFYESMRTRLKHSDDGHALNMTEGFWSERFGSDPAQAWCDYEQKREELGEIFSRYPMLTEMFYSLTEREESENDPSDKTDAGKEADESGVGRGAGHRRRAGAAQRPRARRQTGD
jgi:hypothetical protein